MLLKILNVLVFALLLLTLVFTLYYIYDNIPREPVKLSVIKREIPKKMIEYGDTPVFAENMRFNHNKISYYINEDCSDDRRKAMIKSFKVFEDEVGIISFFSSNRADADIEVKCTDYPTEIKHNTYIAGEGGPSLVINSSRFKVIKRGVIYLYKDERCDYPVISLHELFHVFGFNHTLNKNSIMYSTASCDQRITEDMIKTLRNLYSIEPLPDLEITKLSGVKKGKLIDFNISITNEGLSDAKDVLLVLKSKGKIIDKFNLGDIEIGTGRILRAENVRITSRATNEIEFSVGISGTGEELNLQNNKALLKI